MRFRRFGTNFQPVIQTAEDLFEAVELDPALWAVTSAPTETLHLDAQLLEWLDADSDQRITAATFRAAILWMKKVLKDYQAVDEASEAIYPPSLDEFDEDASQMRRSLEIMQGEQGETAITLTAIRRLREDLESRSTSGVGVLSPEAAAAHPELKAWIEKIVQCLGGVEHPGGGQGLDEATLEQFKQEATARLAWCEQVQPATEAQYLPFGERTGSWGDSLDQLEPRVEAFFAMCTARRLSEQQGITITFQTIESESVKALDYESSSDEMKAWMAGCPIAPINSEGVLPLDERLNPTEAEALKALTTTLNEVAGLKLQQTLNEDDWAQLRAVLQHYRDWKKQEQGASLTSLSPEELRVGLELIESQALKDLMQDCRECVVKLDQVMMAERLALYQSSLIRLANNFISLQALYEGTDEVLFSEGELVLDGRRFRPALRVLNRAEHQKMVQNGGIFVMYLELSDTEDKTTYEVAVPVTRGLKRNIAIGKRGIFEHVNGQQWVARITSIVDEPISFAGAMIAPFERLGEAMTKKLESLTQASEKELDQAGASLVTDVHSSSVKAGETGAAQKIEASKPGGVTQQAAVKPGMGTAMFGGAVAFAALGSSAAYILKTLSDLHLWQIGLGLVGALALVMIPALILVAIRLRRRDLSVLLEGSGWGVNDRMRLVRSQAKTFTRTPHLPLGALLEQRGRGRLWLWLVLVVLILGLGATLYWFSHQGWLVLKP